MKILDLTSLLRNTTPLRKPLGIQISQTRIYMKSSANAERSNVNALTSKWVHSALLGSQNKFQLIYNTWSRVSKLTHLMCIRFVIQTELAYHNRKIHSNYDKSCTKRVNSLRSMYACIKILSYNVLCIFGPLAVRESKHSNSNTRH